MHDSNLVYYAIEDALAIIFPRFSILSNINSSLQLQHLLLHSCSKLDSKPCSSKPFFFIKHSFFSALCADDAIATWIHSIRNLLYQLNWARAAEAIWIIDCHCYHHRHHAINPRIPTGVSHDARQAFRDLQTLGHVLTKSLKQFCCQRPENPRWWWARNNLLPRFRSWYVIQYIIFHQVFSSSSKSSRSSSSE